MLKQIGGRRGYADREVIEGCCADDDAWALIAWDGWDDERWWELPDGRAIDEVLAAGDIASLPPLRLAFERGGRLGDILWSSTPVAPIVSQRFATVLADMGATGYALVPLATPEGIPPYFLLLLDDNDFDDVRAFPQGAQPVDRLDVSRGVMAALRAAHADCFHVEHAEAASQRERMRQLTVAIPS